MKYRLLPVLGAGLLALTLAGCGGGAGGAQAEYIGIEAAKAAALADAGVAEGEAAFSTAGLDRRNGTDYYAVDFTAGGRSYAYDIDAVTGVVIEGDDGAGAAQTPAGGEDDGPASATPAPAAETPAAEKAPATGAQTPETAPAQSTAPAAQSPAAVTGATPQAGEAALTAEGAKEIALDHAGLSANQVTFIRAELDRDDGRLVYDVEFYTADYSEYDYEISASTGEILSYDYDAEGYHPAGGGSAVTADQARETALAQVPGADASHIYEFETDRDDGRLEYEGKIIYNGMEYEFTIDGYTGAIREWEAEPLWD